MPGFQNYVNAQREDIPDYMRAEVMEAEGKNRAANRSATLRNNTLLGGAQLYNAGMGDKTPIADYLDTLGGGGAAAEAGAVLPGVTDVVIPEAPSLMSGLLPSLAESGAAGATGAAGAGAGGAGALGMLGSANPYMSAALLAYGLFS